MILSVYATWLFYIKPLAVGGLRKNTNTLRVQHYTFRVKRSAFSVQRSALGVQHLLICIICFTAALCIYMNGITGRALLIYFPMNF
jgi:hypothetical protein